MFVGTSREADLALAEPITKASRGGVSVETRTAADADARLNDDDRAILPLLTSGDLGHEFANALAKHVADEICSGSVRSVSDRPFISVDELELMSPNERLAAVRDRVVTDLDELPDDFRSRIIATAQSLSDGPRAN